MIIHTETRKSVTMRLSSSSSSILTIIPWSWSWWGDSGGGEGSQMVTCGCRRWRWWWWCWGRRKCCSSTSGDAATLPVSSRTNATPDLWTPKLHLLAKSKSPKWSSISMWCWIWYSKWYLISTERGVLSVARFCYVFACELPVPAWAVGSYSSSQSAGGTLPKTLSSKPCDR